MASTTTRVSGTSTETGAMATRSPDSSRDLVIPLAAESETFSRNANGVRAIYVLPAFSPTPLALGLNVKGLIHGRVRYNCRAAIDRRIGMPTTLRSSRLEIVGRQRAFESCACGRDSSRIFWASRSRSIEGELHARDSRKVERVSWPPRVVSWGRLGMHQQRRGSRDCVRVCARDTGSDGVQTVTISRHALASGL